MLTKVDIRNASGLLLSLPLETPANGIEVRDIKGLDPVKATLSSSKFAQRSGAQFQSATREERNILMKLGFAPDYVTTTVRDLRNQIYDFFMPQEPVYLRFFDDEGLTVDISGYVETCESPLFTSAPAVDISIMCFQPDFLDISPTTRTGNSVSDSTETPVNYPGTIETGFTFVLNVNRSLSEFTIYNRQPDGSLRSLDVECALVAGDILTISTVDGEKSATLVRAGTSSSLLYAVSPQSDWFGLKKGINNLRIYAVGAAIPYSMTYTERYGGL